MGELKTDPFPHVVIDGFLTKESATKVDYSFPIPNGSWYKYENCFETKYATDKWEMIPHEIISVMAVFSSSRFISELEGVFKIEGLVADPHFRGGGLHYIKPGGKLDVHSDFNIHPKLKLQRRLNVILYLNKDWKPEYGGELQLWDRELSVCTTIDPIFNRLVAFETGDDSFHGHPTVWNAPYPRRSIAAYYYTVPQAGAHPHSTLYKRLPGTETTPEVEEFREKRGKGRV